MSKFFRLFARIFLTSVITILLCCGINIILQIKHDKNYSENLEEEIEWDWEQENTVIYKMLNNKYPTEDSENFMMVMRKDEDIPKKEKDEKRIFVIGDSYIYGFGGTNVNYTWWKQLNLQIKEDGYSNVSVYGAGRYFINTKDELEKILKNEKLMKKIDPDLIIIGYVQNDPEERDEENKENLIKMVGEATPKDNVLYKNNPTLYKELEERYTAMEVDYDSLKSMGDLLGKYRWDIWALMVVEGERFERYKNILKDVDDFIKDLDIPYFYYFTDKSDNELADQALLKVYNEMHNMKIDAYYYPLDYNGIRKKLPHGSDYSYLSINPVDWPPGIAQTYYYADYLYDILKNDYKFLFEDAKMRDIDELDLNINDTTPYLKIKKIEKNVFEFEYPKYEEKRTEESNFLYYPIEKEYIKLNLEYPKKISKIIVTGKNLESAEIYVNTIDENYGFDLDEVKRVLTLCEKNDKDEYIVNKEITSVNISAKFYNDNNKKIRLEFIEE